MNYQKIGLILLILVCCSSKSFAQSSLESRIKLQQPYSSSGSEKGGLYYGSKKDSGSVLNDSLINGSLGAMSNMLNGNNTNIYQVQELQKQQLDYVKQQKQNPNEDD